MARGSLGGETSSADQGRPSTRRKRAGTIAGLIAAVLLVVTFLLLSSLPAADSSGQAIVTSLRARYALTVGASYAAVLTSMALIPFTASLKTFAQGPADAAEWRWTVTRLSAAAALALILAGAALLAAAAVLAGQTADGSAVSALFAGAKTSATFALTPFGMVVLANARTVSSSKTPVRWLIKFDLEIGVVALVSSAAVFIHGGGFGAGEQVVAIVGLLAALWIAAIALVMLEGEEAAASS